MQRSQWHPLPRASAAQQLPSQVTRYGATSPAGPTLLHSQQGRQSDSSNVATGSPMLYLQTQLRCQPLSLGCQQASQHMQYAMMRRVWQGGRLRGKQVRRSCHVWQPLPAISAAGSATAAVSGLRHGNRRPSFRYLSCRACRAGSDANPERQTCQHLWRLMCGAGSGGKQWGRQPLDTRERSCHTAAKAVPVAAGFPQQVQAASYCPRLQGRSSSSSSS